MKFSSEIEPQFMDIQRFTTMYLRNLILKYDNILYGDLIRDHPVRKGCEEKWSRIWLTGWLGGAGWLGVL